MYTCLYDKSKSLAEQTLKLVETKPADVVTDDTDVNVSSEQNAVELDETEALLYVSDDNRVISENVFTVIDYESKLNPLDQLVSC